ITKIGGDVTINTDSEGSFSYTGQSNSLTDTGIVFVDETNGSSSGDTISGDGLDNIIVGDSSSERILGFEGNDVLVGMNGDDTMLGGTGLDWLIGGNGDDSLSGDNGNDRLQGDAGNDTLAGGAGADELTGGGGADRFVISAGDSSLSLMDVITDFTPGSDQIDLASYGFSGNLDNSIIENVVSSYTSANSTNFFGSGGGQRGVVVEYSNSDDTARVYIDADSNGDFNAGADVVIQLNNITDNSLSTTDFSNY
ncbi:MAG: calcium-binding protein, partial [Dongiaceae bacterium]